MIHKEFIRDLSDQLEISKKKTSAYTNQLIEIIHQALVKEDIDVRGFGKFIHRDKMRPKFDPDKKLLNEINIK